MASLTTPGIWLPGPLNTINSPSSTAQADIAGNPFFMGLNPGKLVVLSTQEAQNVAAAGTWCPAARSMTAPTSTSSLILVRPPPMRWRDLRRSCFSTRVAQLKGRCRRRRIRFRLLPRQMWRTTLGLKSLFCGVFINPSTVNGASTAPTPGNWTMIFAGGGRVAVNVGSVANVAVGNFVFPDTNNAGKFEGSATASTAAGKQGIGVSAGTSGNQAVAYYPDIILKFIT